MFSLLFYTFYDSIESICSDKGDNMYKKSCSILAYLISISIIFIILVTSIQMNAFRHQFYESEYERLQTAQSINVPSEDLKKATTALLDYLENKREDLQVDIHVRGNVVQAFNRKEILHMEDVKNLYQNVLNIRSICYYIILFGILYLCIKLKRETISYLALRFIKTSLCFFVFVAFLVTYAIIDFNSFWTIFHHIFFTNDLWLLNPATDFMILMFPESLFFQLVLRIAACFIIGFVGLFVLCLYLLKKEMLTFSARNSITLERDET